MACSSPLVRYHIWQNRQMWNWVVRPGSNPLRSDKDLCRRQVPPILNHVYRLPMEYPSRNSTSTSRFDFDFDFYTSTSSFALSGSVLPPLGVWGTHFLMTYPDHFPLAATVLNTYTSVEQTFLLWSLIIIPSFLFNYRPTRQVSNRNEFFRPQILFYNQTNLPKERKYR